MSKRKEIFLLLLSDFIFINLAWSAYYFIRIETGWITYTEPPLFIIPLLVIYCYWLITFSISGLYQHWFVRARFDEFISIVKTISLGCLLLFFIIFIDDYVKNAPVISRFLIILYWIFLVLFTTIGRVFIRSIQINLLEKGVGLRNTVIIGSGQKARDLYSLVKKYPQLGYSILGFISLRNNNILQNNVLGSLSEISNIITKNNVTEILIALETNEKDKLFEILKYCQQTQVNLKIMPDTYEIVSGMVKTNQIYGVPLIEVMPEILSHSSKIIKRVIDIIISLFLLIMNFPLLMIVAIIIKLTSKGPVFYKQKRIGKNRKTFTMYKFRSMIKDAEEYGPEWSGENDPRITKFGKIIRKVYFDETPQLFNVLKNDMSVVGPRPERPHFVEILSNEIPYYYKRLSVKPGITGWSQIKHKYDTSLDDVKIKLQYDFYYIENMSLKLDFKIIINTIIVILLMKGH